MSYSITANIAYHDTMTDTGPSFTGHMWLTLKDSEDNKNDFGLHPKTDGSARDFGDVRTNDSTDYKKIDFSRSFEISENQYNDVKNWAQTATGGDFEFYNGAINNCIDFTWAGLNKAGIQLPQNGDGAIWPSFNRWPLADSYFAWYRRPEFNREARGASDPNYRPMESGDPHSGLPWPGIDPKTARDFALGQRIRKDPLTLDLDGDGIETVAAVPGKSILFDHNGDGIRTGTGWIGSDDGFLVFDRNGNGTIDNGAELFGDATPVEDPSAGMYAQSGYGRMRDGFEALRQEDRNRDGWVDANDANWSRLRVWRDLNQDGKSQPTELFQLAEVGITAIKVQKSENSQVLTNGNLIADIGSFVWTDGRSGTLGEAGRMADIDLLEETFNREFPDRVELAEGVALLPELRGSGVVRDLHEAASQSAGLKELLVRFSEARSRPEQRALLDPLLEAWADTSGLVASLDQRFKTLHGDDAHAMYFGFGKQKISDFYARDEAGKILYPGNGFHEFPLLTKGWGELLAKEEQMLHILEAFNGRYFFNLEPRSFRDFAGPSTSSGGGGGGGIAPPPSISIDFSIPQMNSLDNAYDALKESVYLSLALQTRLSGFARMITPIFDADSYHFDFSTLENYFRDYVARDPANGMHDLLDFNRGYSAVFSSVGWHADDFAAGLIATTPFTPDLLRAYAAVGYIIGRTDGYASAGTTSNDNMIAADAGGGLQGLAGNDILIGGIGKDWMIGGSGNDLYVFAKGGGIDSIDESDATKGNIDIAWFTDVASTEVSSIERRESDLVIRYGAEDVLTIISYFNGLTNSIVEQFVFNDGVTWDVASIKAMALTIGTKGGEYILGYDDGANRIFGLGGGDELYGGALDDMIDGGDGSDYMFGKAGNDSLFGGAGNDNLSGEAGNDTIEGGSGNDRMNGGSGNDLYVFAKGVGIDSIDESDATKGNIDIAWFTDVASTEVSSIERRESDLVIRYGAEDVLTIISYFNGLTNSIVEQLVFNDGVTWDVARIKAMALTIGTKGGEYILGYDDGANRIFGLGGGDELYGGALDDMIDGGDGNDYMFGKAGNDSLFGGGGNDTLRGEAGNDTIEGGSGNDWMNGGSGNDLYVFAKGGGIDSIDESDATKGNIDIAWFTDVASTEVSSIERRESDLVIRYGAEDVLTIISYFNGLTNSIVEQLVFSDGVTWDVASIKAMALTIGTKGGEYILGYDDGVNRIFGLGGGDELYGGALDDMIDGGDGRDYVYGKAGNDSLIGGGGNDDLRGEAGNDTIEGGSGNDWMNGGSGNDLYVFAKGVGIDSIDESDATKGNIDIAWFTDVASTEVSSIERRESDLVIRYGAEDVLTIISYFNGLTNSIVEQLVFSDGVTWDVASIKAMALTIGTKGGEYILGYDDGANRIFGLGGGDELYGGALDDMIDGGDGSDYMFGKAGNDSLFGGGGNDTLRGEAGNDTIEGGSGNDWMNGGSGNDLYVFAKGVGIDSIDESDATKGNIDIAWFTDVASTEVSSIERRESDLVIRYGAEDVLTIISYFNGLTNSIVEQLVFSDGVTWDVARIKAMALTIGTKGDEYILGYDDGANRIFGLGGGDELYGGALDDMIDGGDGSDYMFGKAGNDSLIGGSGNDRMTGDDGNDCLSGGPGDDYLSGGSGADKFDFRTPQDGFDTIGDFASGIDSLRFDAVAFRLLLGITVKLQTGAQAPAAQGSESQFLYNLTTGALYFDGDGAEETVEMVQIAVLAGQPTLSAQDLVAFEFA